MWQRSESERKQTQRALRKESGTRVCPILDPPYVEEVALSSSLALAPVASTAGSGARPNSA